MKTVFITGAASGIGEALVNKLQAQGWLVFAAFRNAKPEATSWYGKENIIPVQCDVTNSTDLLHAYELVNEKTQGALDVLINNAGYSGNAGVVEAPNMDDYRKTFEVNFWAPLQLINTFAALIKNAKGRIINTGSASVYLTIPMGSAYPVSKVALTSLTAHLRMEMQPFGVQVTTLHPGGVETAMTELGEEVGAAQWLSIPEPLRAEYRKYFIDGATAIGSNFKLYSPTEFADKVYKQVITAKRMRPSYLIGPGAAALPWLHRLMPVQSVQNIWAKMFKAVR